MPPTLAGQRILVTGATGLVGRRLAAELEQAGAQVVAAVRRPVQDPAREISWDPAAGRIDLARLEDIDAVVHLAGENIAHGRWTDAFKQKILDSRVKGTQLISTSLAKLGRKPRALICASAIGYYGDRGDEVLSESSHPANDFLAQVCQQWEAACQPARDAGIRTANVRIGVVLSPDGGALRKMLTPFRLGGGGVMGSGRQYMSWIAIDDVAAAIQFVIENAQLSGPVNLVAPHPVTNREFTRTLGHVLRRPTLAWMPAFAVKILFGEMGESLLLSSTRVAPQALLSAGFQFRDPELEPALRRLLAR